MTTPAVQVERRVAQRFPYLLPVSFSQAALCLDGVGFTQDLSSRGVFFFTDTPLLNDAEIEITLRMPSEITLGESMPVRCHGRILRLLGPAPASSHDAKIGVAVRIDRYEYLSESADTALHPRVSALHPQHEAEKDRPQSHVRTLLS